MANVFVEFEKGISIPVKDYRTKMSTGFPTLSEDDKNEVETVNMDLTKVDSFIQFYLGFFETNRYNFISSDAESSIYFCELDSKTKEFSSFVRKNFSLEKR